MGICKKPVDNQPHGDGWLTWIIAGGVIIVVLAFEALFCL